MDDLVDGADVTLKVADQLLVVLALCIAGNPSSWYSFTASAILPT
jgi:hypothetical protein